MSTQMVPEVFPFPGLSPRSPGWWRDRVVFLAGVVVLLIMAGIFSTHGEGSDAPRCFLIAGRHMLQREAIHRLTETYSYPPATAFLLLPICRMPQTSLLVTWYLLNALAIASLFHSAWKLAGGPKLIGMENRWHGVFWLGAVLLMGRFFLAPLENMQSDIIVAAMVLGGCRLIWSGRDVTGGSLIGTAAAMKCTPLLFVPYLILRRRWGAAAGVLVAAALWNVLPDLLLPQSNGHSYLGDWAHTYLSFAGKSAPGVWHSDLLLNQSLGGACNRWLRLGLGLPVLDAHMSGRELPLSAVGWLKWGTYGMSALLLGTTVFCGGKWLRRLPNISALERAPLPWHQLHFSVEVAAVLALMLLLSPMSGKAHFVSLLLPCLLIARWIIERPGWVTGALLAVLVVCGPLGSKSLLGTAWGQHCLIWGTPTLFALGTLVFCWRILRASDVQGSRIEAQVYPVVPAPAARRRLAA